MDEPVHYYRAYQISTGAMLAIRQGDGIGGTIPQNIDRWVDAAETNLYGGRIWGATNFAYREMRRYWAMPLDAETAHFKSFKSSAFYPPVIYLPQSMGLWLARQLGEDRLRYYTPDGLQTCWFTLY